MAKTTKTALRATVAAEGRCILAIGSHCWGKGPDARTAIRNAQKEGRPLKDGWKLLDVDAKTYMDEMGYVCWPQGARDPQELGFA